MQTWFEVDGMKSVGGVRKNMRHGHGEDGETWHSKIIMADFLLGSGYVFKRLFCVFS